MNDITDLYQDLILDHSRRPRNFGTLATANLVKEGFNPLCGDQLIFYLHVKDDVVQQAMFNGTGCAISMASGSLLTELMLGKTTADVCQLFDYFHTLVTSGEISVKGEEMLGKLMALAGVAAYPVRVKCATLAWHTMRAALLQDDKLITTE